MGLELPLGNPPPTSGIQHYRLVVPLRNGDALIMDERSGVVVDCVVVLCVCCVLLLLCVLVVVVVTVRIKVSCQLCSVPPPFASRKEHHFWRSRTRVT